MKVRKEPIVTAAEAAAAFNRNTEEILKNAPKPVEDGTNKMLKQFFGNICKGFIDGSCTQAACKNAHRFPSATIVTALFEKCTPKEIDEAYGIVSQHQRFLEAYISMFAELYVKRTDYEPRLARMIMDCEQNAKTHSMYRSIVEALVTHGRKQRYEAVEFLIKHHTPSRYANEEIMKLCADTGAEIVRFMDYFRQVFRTQSIPESVLDKILANCVTYQSAALPAFCLDNLFTKDTAKLRQLNQDNITKFVNLQMAFTEGNSAREGKLETFLKKL